MSMSRVWLLDRSFIVVVAPLAEVEAGVAGGCSRTGIETRS